MPEAATSCRQSAIIAPSMGAFEDRGETRQEKNLSFERFPKGFVIGACDELADVEGCGGGKDWSWKGIRLVPAATVP
jgi:hypothetical protein